MHSLLLGNGINRVSLATPWSTLLDELAETFHVKHQISRIDQKPLSIVFEEICARCEGGVFRETEMMVKKAIGSRLYDVKVNELHRSLLDLFSVILTTNYDDTLERAASGPLFHKTSPHTETRYSLFRRTEAASKEIWHIHGEYSSPSSILLGYDQYAGYLQKIRNYLTHGIRIGKGNDLIKSPLKTGSTDFEKYGIEPSWVDHFLRDHLHIVGLGLDFTEMDLWWLLLHKRRRRNVTGHTFYYQVNVPIRKDQNIAKLSALESLGVRVHEVSSHSYEQGYKDLIPLIGDNIRLHRSLLTTTNPSYSLDQIDTEESPDREPEAPHQMSLQPLRKKARRRVR